MQKVILPRHYSSLLSLSDSWPHTSFHLCCSRIQLNETYLAILTLFTPPAPPRLLGLLLSNQREGFFKIIIIKAMTLSSLPHLAFFF